MVRKLSNLGDAPGGHRGQSIYPWTDSAESHKLPWFFLAWQTRRINFQRLLVQRNRNDAGLLQPLGVVLKVG